MPLQDLPDHLPRGHVAHAPDAFGHGQLQREDRQALLRLHAHDRAPRHRRGREPVLPQSLAGQSPRRLSLPGRGARRPQAHDPARPEPRDRARPGRQARPRVLQAQLAHRPRGHRQDLRGFARRRAGADDHPRHLLPAARHPRQDRQRAYPLHRGPLFGARAHLLLWRGLRHDLPVLGRHDDAQHRAPCRDRLPRARSRLPRHRAEVRGRPAARQREGTRAHGYGRMGARQARHGRGRLQLAGVPAAPRLRRRGRGGRPQRGGGAAERGTGARRSCR